MSSSNAARPMTPEELVANGYPADLHTRPGAYQEWQSRVPAGQHQVNVPEQQPHYSQPDVKKARDKAVYTREQTGHSITLHLLFGGFVLWIPAVYYTFSPRHYWHA